MSDPEFGGRPFLVAASLSGAADAEWALTAAPHVDAAVLGGIALDSASRAAARDLVARERTEFLPADPLAWIDRQLDRLADAPLRPGVNVRSATVGPVREAAGVCAEHGAVCEVNAHCRQPELRAVGCGESLLRDADRLAEYVAAAAETGATTGVKVRAEVPGVDLVAVADAVADAGADWLHVDAMDSEAVVADLTAGRGSAAGDRPRDDLTVIANNGVRGRESVAEYAAHGADAVSVGRPSERPAALKRVADAVAGWRAGELIAGSDPSPSEAPPVRFDPVDDATLALLLEVAGTPKPGNVDRRRDLDDLRFEAFLGGAVGAREGLELAADGETGVGSAFERGVAGMAARTGTNTQFGCLLLLAPLVRATVEAGGDGGAPSPADADRVTRATTVDDAVAFYRAFEHVDVAVADPPADAADLDVRRGSDAAPALRDRGATLRDVMALSADPPDYGDSDASERIPDRNAQEWIEGFPRTFRAAEWIRGDEGPLTDRAARAFLGLLAAEPDTLVAATHGPGTAREASERAVALLGAGDESPAALAGVDTIDAAAVHGADLNAAEELATAFVDEGINPGTTADLVCAALYVALRRGAEVSP